MTCLSRFIRPGFQHRRLICTSSWRSSNWTPRKSLEEHWRSSSSSSRWTPRQGLEALMAEFSKHSPASDLSERISSEAERFMSWRRAAVFKAVSLGFVLGACGLAAAVYWSVDRRTLLVELTVSAIANASFRRARSYNERKEVMIGIPEMTLPLDAMETEAIARIHEAAQSTASTVSTEQSTLTAWGELATKTFVALDWSAFITRKAEMRGALVEEVIQSDLPLAECLNEIRSLLPPSVERDTAMSAVFARSEWHSADMLEVNVSNSSSEPCGTLAILLVKAFAFFPGSFNQLVLFLRGHLADEFTSVLSSSDSESAAVVSTAMHEVRGRFHTLSERLQKHILLSALTQKISLLERLGEYPYELYVKAVDSDLLGPLRREASLSEDVLREVRNVYLALPPRIQARVLLTAIEHPSSRGDFNAHAQAEMVRDLFAAGGVVAVKLAQMLAEDTRVPRPYREMFGSLRDENEAMDANVFWHSIPSPVRSHITHLGPCLGTGSVKQVNRARFDDNTEYAVAVLRRGVEDEALASLSALEASPLTEMVAGRLKHLIYGEFNLFAEGEALGDFASTSIGTHESFHVVGVKHNSPRCLVEEIAKGPTVAQALRHVCPGEAVDDSTSSTLETLVEFHRAVIGAFMNGGLVHSDIHLGNMVQESCNHFALFDVGQFMRISTAETTALLWTMCWMSTPLRHSILRRVALKHLISVSSIRGPGSGTIRRRLSRAFDEAVGPYEDGTFPEPKQAWMRFLRNAEMEGVALPQGAFALAKMMDSMLSQQEAFDLPHVLQDSCEGFLRKNVTWGETQAIFNALVFYVFFGRADRSEQGSDTMET